MALKPALFTLLAVALCVSVVTDLRRRRIFDWVTLPTAVLALSARGWLEGLGDSDRGVLSGLWGLAACLVVFGGFALANKSIGWGDVKLLAAVGAAFGFPLALAALMFVSLAGAAQAIVTLSWQGAVGETLRGVFKRTPRQARGERKQAKPLSPSEVEGRFPALPQHPARPRQRYIPYAVAIALGSFWTMWWDHWGGAGT